MKLANKNIIKCITDYQPTCLVPTPISASVMMLVVEDEKEEFFLLLTQRPWHIKTYPGHYCFPGGMKEMADNDLSITAIREVKEELGISPADYQVIGQLDDFQDRDGQLVRPFVGLVAKEKSEIPFVLAPEEVASLYYFPLREVKSLQADPLLTKLTCRSPTYVYCKNEVFIWGLTASMLVHLGNIIYGLNWPISRGV